MGTADPFGPRLTLRAWRLRLVLLSFLVVIFIKDTASENLQIDLNGADCDQLGGFELKDMNSEITVFANYQYNVRPTRDHCDVEIRAQSTRRIQYAIDIIRFQWECGVEIILYDNPNSDIDPRRIITCDDNNKRYIEKTRYNVMRIRLRKTTAESRNFFFQMRLRDDRGPSIEYMGTDANYEGEGLDPSAIAGIAIAGAIIILALILIALYLCIRARNDSMKANQGRDHGAAESSVYTSGTSQVLFASGSARHPKGRYGSMEDIPSPSTQGPADGAYTNSAYTSGPGEKKSSRSSSLGRTRGTKMAGFTNGSFDGDSSDMGRGDVSWEQGRSPDLTRGGEGRRSRKDSYDNKKPKKSAMKKREVPPQDSRVNTQPLNSILKRAHSPSRSHTSSNEGSYNTNALVNGYKHEQINHPNLYHKPVLERKRSRSGTRSNRSGSSAGRSSTSHQRRSQSADKKKQANKGGGRMYNDVFFDEPKRRSSRSRSRSRHSDRMSDSIDSASSATSTSYSKKVSLNPGGKRVQIKGEETDI